MRANGHKAPLFSRPLPTRCLSLYSTPQGSGTTSYFPLSAITDRLDARNQLIGIDHPKRCWGGQEDLRPVLMGLKKTKEAGALGEPGKQRPIVARQPAIEGPVAHAFQGMQEPQGHHFTGPEVSLGMFGDSAQLLIDLIEQGGDKLHGAHTALLSWAGCPHTSVEELSDDCKPKNLCL